MTWDELAAKIAAMHPDERKQTVRFAEPYDAWYVHEPKFLRADWDILKEPEASDIEIGIRDGEAYLG